MDGTMKDEKADIVMEKQTEYDMEYSFSLNKFVDFMLIQSNVNARIESGSDSADEIRKWMMESLAPIFDGRERQLVFYGYSWYIRGNKNDRSSY